MQLDEVLSDIADSIVDIDTSRIPFRLFQPGVGPYGEPQLLRLIKTGLNSQPKYGGCVVTKRTPDLLIPDEWAIEFKITRPYGDNGKEAENWSVNLLHPYPGSVSTIGDCWKLVHYPGTEHLAIIVIGYEHSTTKTASSPNPGKQSPSSYRGNGRPADVCVPEKILYLAYDL